ncbi:MAG: S-adenosyl-l-methionine hydroxide adenosyltransferase family protein [Phormidesmis sp.]
MITLLSDFGYQDAYVAVMKGIIAAIAPAKITCDLTHAIEPQNILAARFNLKLAYPHFPPGTVHLAVVDPGVGSTRKAIAVKCSNADTNCFLVGPDNGVLSGVIEDFMADPKTGRVAAVVLNNSRYWRNGLTGSRPSHTFHGRDIFAPVAAHLASGVALESLGDLIEPHLLVKPDLEPFTPSLVSASSKQNKTRTRKFQPRSHSESVQGDRITLGIGCIQHVDGFGNLISNIPEHVVAGIAWSLLLKTPLKSPPIPRIKTYSDVPLGNVAALVGSHGWLEVARNQGSAAIAVEEWGGAPVGTPLEIILETSI